MENVIMKKVALVTGITGQTGSYLAEYLIELGYEVHGIVRRISSPKYDNIIEIIDKIKLHNADMTDSISLYNVIKEVNPDEIYNFAGMSQVRYSYDSPVSTFDINTLGLLRIIESVRSLKLDCKIYQACSSEMFGKVQETPQTEKTPFYPRSPYGISKAAAYYIARTYREAYNMKIYCGIVFNHECISKNNTITIRENGILKILRPCDLRKPRDKKSIETWEFDNIDIWDGSKFVKLKAMTATKKLKKNKDIEDYKFRITNTRNGIIETTNHHNLYDENMKKDRADHFTYGNILLHGKRPMNQSYSIVTKEESELIGMLVADGSLSENGHGKFTKNNKLILKRISELLMRLRNSSLEIPLLVIDKMYKHSSRICFRYSIGSLDI